MFAMILYFPIKRLSFKTDPEQSLSKVDLINNYSIIKIIRKK